MHTSSSVTASTSSSSSSSGGSTKQANKAAEPWGHVKFKFGVTNGFEFFRATFGALPSCSPYTRTLVADPPHACPWLANDDMVDSISGESIVKITAGLSSSSSENQVLLLVERGNCSFQDKAQMAKRVGASGIVVINTKPGLIRMPSGLLNGTKEAGNTNDVTAVMISTSSGSVLRKTLANDPLVGIGVLPTLSNVKGTVFSVGERCNNPVNAIGASKEEEVEEFEIESDGESSSSSSSNEITTGETGSSSRTDWAEEVEGGHIEFLASSKDGHAEDKAIFDFLTGQFGGPIPFGKSFSVGKAEPRTACTKLSHTAESAESLESHPHPLAGKAVLVSRGECMFSDKTHIVDAVGGLVVLVGNTQGGLQRMFHGDRDLDHAIAPTVMISKRAVHWLEEHLQGNGNDEVTVSFKQGDVKSSEWEKIAEMQEPGWWPSEEPARRELLASLQGDHSASAERATEVQESFDGAQSYYGASSSQDGSADSDEDEFADI